MLKECLFCHTEFVTTHKEVRYCSANCKLQHLERIAAAKARGHLVTCKHCKINFVPRRRGIHYCSDKCRLEYKNHLTGRVVLTDQGLSTGEVGAIAELMVGADLLTRGYEVFRSVSPNCSCDLIAVDGEDMFKVEVRTGHRGMTDKITYNSENRAHIVAVYVPSERIVVYYPDLPFAPNRAAKLAENSTTPGRAVSR